MLDSHIELQVPSIVTLEPAELKDNYIELKTIAEGVETNEQVGFLKEYKCGLMQGYYFSLPLPPEDAVQFLKDRLSEERLEESWYSITN